MDMPKNTYSMEDVYKTAGEPLRKFIDVLKGDGYFGDENDFLKWWYDPNNKGLGKSPDEVCKEGKQKELEAILMTVFVGPHGG